MSLAPLRSMVWRLARRVLTPRMRAKGRAALDRAGVPAATVDRVRTIARGPVGAPLVEIGDVTLPPPVDGAARADQLELPARGTKSPVHGIEIAGSLNGSREPVGIDVVHGDAVLRRITMSITNPAMAASGAAASRTFRGRVGTVGLPASFEIGLRVVYAEGEPEPLATIRGQRALVQSSYSPRLRPLLVTTMGRSGGTWLMRLLAEHPEIVAFRAYPYELRTGRYWLHMLAALGQPADHAAGGDTQDFFRDRSRLGPNPYYPDWLGSDPRLDGWFGRDYIEQLAAFCQLSIDESYLQIAATQGQTVPLFFAEKHLPDAYPWLAWEVYPNARELFLVRDPRDTFASITAFNERRGNIAFGRGLFASDEAYIRDRLRGAMDRLRTGWQARADRAHLVRYEDLITRPTDTLGGILTYLGLASDAATVDRLLQRAARDTPELKQHRTSKDPLASIGRWRDDVPEDLQAVAAEVLGESLTAFGYDV